MKNFFLLIWLSLCLINTHAQITIDPDAVAQTHVYIPYAIYPLGDSRFTEGEVKELIKKNDFNYKLPS